MPSCAKTEHLSYELQRGRAILNIAATYLDWHLDIDEEQVERLGRVLVRVDCFLAVAGGRERDALPQFVRVSQ